MYCQATVRLGYCIGEYIVRHREYGPLHAWHRQGVVGAQRLWLLEEEEEVLLQHPGGR